MVYDSHSPLISEAAMQGANLLIGTEVGMSYYKSCALCSTLKWCFLDYNDSEQHWLKHGLVRLIASRFQETWSVPANFVENVLLHCKKKFKNMTFSRSAE